MSRLLSRIFLIAIVGFSSSVFAQSANNHSIVFLNAIKERPLSDRRLSFPSTILSGLRPRVGDTTLPLRLWNAISDVYNNSKPYDKHGVAASVIAPGMPQWSGGVGQSDDVTPMTSDLLFEIGSNTKTFVTALILRLQDEGKLSIKDSLFKYLPSYPNIDGTITIEQLLNHSSGIFDYLNDDVSDSVLTDAYVYHPTHKWTTQEILNGVKTPNFKPGKGYQYSNTNFILLGMIAEAVTKHPLGEELRTRFLGPLGLTNTFIGWDTTFTENFAHNYTQADSANPGEDLSTIDRTAQLSAAWAAGGIVSTPTDLARWSNALYTGTLLSKSTMTQMLKMHRWSDGSYYGLGTVRVPYYTSYLYGHTGRLIGFESMMLTEIEDSVTFVVYLNSDPSDAGMTSNDYAIAILNEVYQANSTTAKPDVKPIEVFTYPNPATTQATIAFRTLREEQTRVEVMDNLGRSVQVLVNSNLPPGIHTAHFDASALPNGTYHFVVRTLTAEQTGNIQVTH